MAATFTNVTPIIRILNEQQAKEFYVDFLAFNVDWEYRGEGPLYMQISRGDVLIHLSEHRGDAATGAAFKIHTPQIEDFVEELAARTCPAGISKQQLGVARQPWGSLDMLLVDPFGNRLVFTNAEFQIPSHEATIT
ncbi:MAG: glyoxalase superfamily protein [Planctomycetaceae bacterium]